MSLVNSQYRPQKLTKGIILIVATVFVISIQDVFFKLFSNELSLWQIFSVRALLAFPLLFALAWTRGIHTVVLADALSKWPLLRSLFLTLTFMAFYAAIPFLSLSTVGAANYIAPIFVTLLSAYVIAEPVGARGWVAVLLGFAGVVILLQPGTEAFSAWALLPVLGASFYALSHITTRTKCHSTPLATLALSLNITMLAAGLFVSGLLIVWQPNAELVRAYPSILGAWSNLSTREWLLLALLAVFVVLIGIMLAGAYQAAPPSTVATFEYSYLIFVAIWDFLFFEIPPNSMTLAGMLLIVSAGMLALNNRSRIKKSNTPYIKAKH